MITFVGGTAAAYCWAVVRSLNIELVSGEAAEGVACRFSW